MKHPGDELYAELGPAFAHRGYDGFAGLLSSLGTLVHNDAADEEVDRAYAALMDGIRAAESHTDPITARDWERHVAIVINLLRTAAEEYGIGIVDGRIENLHEYQDAYGFTQVALDRAEAAHRKASSDTARAQLAQVITSIEKLTALWPGLVPVGPVNGDAASIAAVADETGEGLRRLRGA